MTLHLVIHLSFQLISELGTGFRMKLGSQLIHLFLMRNSQLGNLLLLFSSKIRDAQAEIPPVYLLCMNTCQNHESKCR